VGLEILIRELRIADTLPRLAMASRCAYLFSTIRLRSPHDLAALVRHSRKYLVGDASFLQ
jgi:hypothetical protein